MVKADFLGDDIQLGTGIIYDKIHDKFAIIRVAPQAIILF